MEKKYNQLSQAQRYRIETLFKTGHGPTFIAQQIGCHKSTVSRELKRNIPQRGVGAKIYVAEKAQCKTDVRHKLKLKHIKFSDKLKAKVLTLMREERYSPALVAAHWVRENISGVSHETIYKFIWSCKHTNKRLNKEYKVLHTYLKHGKRHRKRGNYKDTRGCIPNRVSIDKRPKIVEKRKRFGDIEVDLIMGKDHKSAVLVTIDRRTLHTTINKMESKNAKAITKVIIKRLKKFKGKLKTITFDNDKAFVEHEKIGAALGAKTFFTRPYTSQDKGTIENRNGVIRLFFPKKTDFRLVSDAEIKEVEKKINNRPIKKHGYLSAKEMLAKFAA